MMDQLTRLLTGLISRDPQQQYPQQQQPNWDSMGIVITPTLGWVLLLHTTATFVGGFFVGKLFKRRAGDEDTGAAAAAAQQQQRALGSAAGGALRRTFSFSGGGAPRKLRPESSLRQPGRTVAVVTTAALPWRTGTSVNPLLRCAHLAAETTCKVLLVVPWLEPEEQALVFPPGQVFQTREEHAEFILKEARERSCLPCDFRVLFYSGKYYPLLGSILPVGDITASVPPELADVAILEEPEHLNWCQHASRWTDKFRHVVGVMHTNYLAYIANEAPGSATINVAALKRVNKWVCRIHCHKVVKLSDAVQRLPRQVTCNVHGVGSNFLSVGRARRSATAEEYGGRRFSKGAYFIGKAVWGKGYRELLSLLATHQERVRARREARVMERLERSVAEDGLAASEAAALAAAASAPGASFRAARAAAGSGVYAFGSPAHCDVYGSGEDLDAIKSEAAARGLDVSFRPGRDHADAAMHDYQVFVNPSTSDVVATTTAEALAMGKWVVVEDIACNEFFKQFANCLTYTDPAGFSDALLHALSNEPSPMDEETLGRLSWESATQRLLDVTAIAPEQWPSPADERYAAMVWRMYRSVTGFQVLRQALGLDSTSPDDRPTEEADADTDEGRAEWELWHDLVSIRLNRAWSS